jgi:DNA-binding GntR family transcriptional regulator
MGADQLMVGTNPSAQTIHSRLGLSIAPNDTTSQVATALRTAILSGVLPPHTPLREASIAAELQVSRNTVREAARILSAESLIRHMRNRGFVVADLDDEELDEIYQAREAIEIVGLLQLTENQDVATIAHLSHIAGVIGEAVKSADVAASLENDNAFHATLVEYTHNRHLVQIHRGLQRELRLALSLAERSARQLGRSTDDHHLLVEAIRTGEKERAANALRQHLAAGVKELKLLRSL